MASWEVPGVRITVIESLTSFSLSQFRLSTPYTRSTLARNSHQLVSEAGDERTLNLDFVSIAFLMMVQRSTFILCPSDWRRRAPWAVRRAETEIDVSSLCTFAKANIAPHFFYFFPCGLPLLLLGTTPSIFRT